MESTLDCLSLKPPVCDAVGFKIVHVLRQSNRNDSNDTNGVIIASALVLFPRRPVEADFRLLS